MLSRTFFQRDPLTCAQELIGCELVWNSCAGLIVETEAYAAVGDEAAHTFTRPSARAFVADHQAGAAYVYFNYGMYWLFNVLVKGGAADGFVLIRARTFTHEDQLRFRISRAKHDLLPRDVQAAALTIADVVNDLKKCIAVRSQGGNFDHRRVLRWLRGFRNLPQDLLNPQIAIKLQILANFVSLHAAT